MEQHDPMILLRDVTKVYPLGKGKGSITAVKGLNLGIERGEFVVVTGRSGSGKTTLLNLISGLARPTSGEVRLNGIEVWRLPDARQSLIRNRNIGFIFQFPSLMPALTALENVMLPALAAPVEDRRGAERRARQLLEEVGLGDRLNAFPCQLSAGQQQRVVVARALINEPELLLADEPTSNLDEETEREIMELIRGIHLRSDITVVLVTHSSELVRYGTGRLRMAAGEIGTSPVAEESLVRI
ncbi:MAG: ABC transporter ATP-binding protein [Sphingomonadaceae bacterium]